MFVFDKDDLPPMESAQTWTRKNVKEFKESLKMTQNRSSRSGRVNL